MLRLVKLQVTAIDCGTHYVVINRQGKKASILKASDTGELSSERISFIEPMVQWRAAFARMRSSLLKQVKKDAKQAWESKFSTWQHSLKLRIIYERAPRKNNRFYTDHSRPDWERAAECMVMSYYNRVMRKNRHAIDPWSLWAETASKNHNRKERCRGM